MSIISKADLSRELGVSKARVSQYVKSGLPVRSDGKLDRETVLEYIRMYYVSETGSTKGPVRAKNLLHTGPQIYDPANEEPYGEHFKSRASEAQKASVTVLHQLLVKSRRMVARAAIECGAPLNVAYMMVDILHSDLASAAYDILEGRGIRGFNACGGTMTDCNGPDPSWEAYAHAIGETFDQEAIDREFEFLPLICLEPRLGDVVED